MSASPEPAATATKPGLRGLGGLLLVLVDLSGTVVGSISMLWIKTS